MKAKLIGGNAEVFRLEKAYVVEYKRFRTDEEDGVVEIEYCGFESHPLRT